MQGVSIQREVEGVTADFTCWLQPGGEGELPGLARERTRQQPMLDLGRERQRDRPLAPFEEVGVAAVRGDDAPPGERCPCDGPPPPPPRRALPRQPQDAATVTPAGPPP